MNLLQRISSFFARTPVMREVSIIPQWKHGVENIRPTDYRALMEEGYRKNSLINACIDTKAESVAEPDLVVMRNPEKEERVEEKHPLVQLLNKPNRMQSQYRFLQKLIIYLEATGNVYVHKVRPRVGGPPVMLRLLRPDRMSIKPDSLGYPVQYIHKIESKETPIDAQDVIHILKPDPLDDLYGLAPSSVLARYIDLDNSSIDYLRSFFVNAGVPQGFLKFKVKKQPKDRTAAKQLWQDEYGGVHGWHRVAVLDDDVDYKELGSRPAALDLSNIFTPAETRICSVYGVPPIIIALKAGLDAATYSNYKQALKSFWHQTLRPMYTELADDLTRGLASEWGDEDLRITFDLSSVEALGEDEDKAIERASKGFDSSIITRNEAREIIGQERDDDGDVYKVKMTDMLVEGDEVGAIPAATDDETQALSVVTNVKTIETWANKKRKDPFWRFIHKIADEGSTEIQKVFLDALRKVMSKIDIRALEKALADNDIEAAFNAIPWKSTAMKDFEEKLPKAIRKIYTTAAIEAQAALPEGVSFSFSDVNPRAVAFVEAQAAQLITVIDDDAKLAIRELVRRMTEGEFDARKTARLIRAHIGLSKPLQKAVDSAYLTWIGEGLPIEKVLAKVERYSAKLIRYRAKVIARNEGMTAANEGQRELWQQGLEQGELDSNEVEKLWIVTPDDRLCAKCSPLTNERADLDGVFSNGRNGPPAHIQCRCAQGLVRKEVAKAS